MVPPKRGHSVVRPGDHWNNEYRHGNKASAHLRHPLGTLARPDYARAVDQVKQSGVCAHSERCVHRPCTSTPSRFRRHTDREPFEGVQAGGASPLFVAATPTSIRPNGNREGKMRPMILAVVLAGCGGMQSWGAPGEQSSDADGSTSGSSGRRQAAPKAHKGCKCGNSYIDCSKRCHK